MTESIKKFCSSISGFCNHLQSSCDALKHSLDRRPIPLDSASATFMQSLNRRVSTTSADLNLLESMSCDTVSFEELLGHCTQVFNNNQIHLLSLQDHLISTSSYIPSADTDEDQDEGEKELDDDLSPFISCKTLPLSRYPDDDDPLLDDSLSLKNLGLSDVCLATIASEANNSIQNVGTFEEAEEEIVDELMPMPFKDSKSWIDVSREDYESLPKHMKSLASWEDLVAAVEKINSSLTKRSSKPVTFHQDEIASLGLGHKARSYVLLLIKMNHIVVETIDGVISYRVL
ncbi:hypothetical protein ACH5RR_005731 [Cinchona calisaya]|uniref:Spindle and kinetochore-associated protein 3 n=1 Tax=Cinchona calisaya TaxID=153742 RepID=A0ABD3AM00_9GENT